MKVIVVGCGRIGVELSYNLYKRGHEVSVVDSIPAALNNLPPDFNGRTQEGDALNQDVLERAGIKTCDALAAVTNSDALNAAVSHVARVYYNVPTIIARNYDPHIRAIYEAFGIQNVSSTAWGAQRVEELLYHADAKTVFSAGNGEIEIYELTISEQWNGHPLKDLMPCEDCRAVALTHAGKAYLPDPEMIVQTGDVLTVAATFDGIETTRAFINQRKGA
ncbi:MAG TPA: portal protein [Anaerolineaceae bacterium]|jgi:trk system potassium uptake protein TrkA|nr:portal protein [Anaerolineaceae bacterium]